SVFLKPREEMLGIGRAQMSFVFGLATICLVAGMNLSPLLYRPLPAVPELSLAGAGRATGRWVAGSAGGLGRCVLCCGRLLQQGVNQTLASSGGLVNGYVVALYPLGAMIGAPLFGYTIAAFGLRATLAGLGATVLAACVFAAWLLARADIRMRTADVQSAGPIDRQWPVFARLFAVFFLAAAAGLTVMSQAAGIVQAYGGRTALALGATTFITGAIAAARVGGGWLADRFQMPRVAAAAHLWSLAGARRRGAGRGPRVAGRGLALIGMGYGFMSGAVAGAIARYWHRNEFGRIAGQLYIAWCIAAVSLPILAGWLFDRTGGYGAAVLVAAGGTIGGASCG